MFMTVFVTVNEANNEFVRLQVDEWSIEPLPSVKDIIFVGAATWHWASTVVRQSRREFLVLTLQVTAAT